MKGIFLISIILFSQNMVGQICDFEMYKFELRMDAISKFKTYFYIKRIGTEFSFCKTELNPKTKDSINLTTKVDSVIKVFLYFVNQMNAPDSTIKIISNLAYHNHWRSVAFKGYTLGHQAFYSGALKYNRIRSAAISIKTINNNTYREFGYISRVKLQKCKLYRNF